MPYSTCPGQDRRFWKPSDIRYEVCPSCGASIEFWKDDVKRSCPSCGNAMINPSFDPGCARWCPYAERCLGDVAVTYRRQPSIVRDRFEAQLRRHWENRREPLNRVLGRVMIAEELLAEGGGNALVVLASTFLAGLDGDTQAEILERVGLPEDVRAQVMKVLETLETGQGEPDSLDLILDAIVLDDYLNGDGERPSGLNTEVARKVLNKREA
jgi:hypothetical protein